MRIWPCVYSNCVCLHERMHVYGCVLYGECVVFVCLWPCLYCDCVCLHGVCMFVNVCACLVVVLCLHVSSAMFVW